MRRTALIFAALFSFFSFLQPASAACDPDKLLEIYMDAVRAAQAAQEYYNSLPEKTDAQWACEREIQQEINEESQNQSNIYSLNAHCFTGTTKDSHCRLAKREYKKSGRKIKRLTRHKSRKCTTRKKNPKYQAAKDLKKANKLRDRWALRYSRCTSSGF